MAVRRLVAAAVLMTLTGCGGSTDRPSVSLVAPVWIDEDIAAFERETGCRVELRVYDEGEDVSAIAKRRDADIVATPAPRGGDADQSEEFVRITLEGGVEVTIPKRYASAFDGPSRAAGRKGIVWRTTRRGNGDDRCISRWLRSVTPSS
jgi:hypothetical protein